ncbi:magnesium transporter MgtE N-terminal domain-containing protein [Streptomyces sp. NBC_01236]|uniref:magnesium transporter MgtE N-terminal domain-containing protein n=1 Tax=Streptomyces sp. NBC_01236 TaxID=2903789 RepID=UPI002E0E43A9|nr:hypothetical protein OG324_50340 [Streptomyces sp. NBC_01236]
MGELKPLQDGLAEPQRALASELRALFAGLGVSVTRYSARVHLDKSVISRYLSGTHIPPWGFVRELLVQSTQEREGVPPTVEVVSHLQALHRRALESGNAVYHTVLLLQDLLAEADQDARRARMRERDLEAGLEAARLRIADLSVRERELEAALEAGRDGRADVAARHVGEEDFQGLRQEIERLERELESARRRHAAAEERCIELERQLDSAQRRSDGVGLDLRLAIQALAALSPLQAAAELGDMDRDWGAVVLKRMDPLQAAATLAQVEPVTATDLLGRLMPSEAVPIVSLLKPQQVIAFAQHMNPRWAAAAARQMDTQTIAAIADLLPADKSAAVFSGIPPHEAVTILELMEPAKKAAVLELADPTWVAAFSTPDKRREAR